MTKRILIIDDDQHLVRVMSRSLERQGYQTAIANTGAEAFQQADSFAPEWITLDLRLEQESGLQLLPGLIERCPQAKIVMLTGYASIATAVEAIKQGAHNYLHKPATIQELLAAFGDTAPEPDIESEAEVMSVDRLEWEHIQRVLNEHEGNISATARALNMHRRTLQRKLQKHAPR
ncbi:MAG: response regulator transcription factor [Oceanobacter sp.]